MTTIIEKELSYRLGGIFFEMQDELGRFCRERQYADALEEKLVKEQINFKREFPLEIGGRKSNFVDFVIEDKVLIDLKAKPFITREDYYQMKRYLNVAGLELGLIVNFQDKYLKPKRVLNENNTKKGFVDSDKFVGLDRSQRGYIAITTVIILSLVMLILAVSIGSSALLTRYNTVDFSNKRVSHYTAFSCLEYSRLKLAENTSYGGNATTTVGSYQCYVFPIETSGSNKIIKSRSIVGGATTNFKLTINSGTLSTVSLEEAVKF